MSEPDHVRGRRRQKSRKNTSTSDSSVQSKGRSRRSKRRDDSAELAKMREEVEKLTKLTVGLAAELKQRDASPSLSTTATPDTRITYQSNGAYNNEYAGYDDGSGAAGGINGRDGSGVDLSSLADYTIEKGGVVSSWNFWEAGDDVKAQMAGAQYAELVVEQRQKDKVIFRQGVQYAGEAVLTFDQLTTDFVADRVRVNGKSPFDGIIQKLREERGFAQPTGIQTHCWTSLFKGYDVLGIAKTGSGKTLGFLLPAFLHIIKREEREGDLQSKFTGQAAHPEVLILAPTRELAIQIHEEAIMSLVGFGMSDDSFAVCYGGSGNRQWQVRALERRPRIVVGVPGRAMDFMQNHLLKCDNVSFFVLDEADRMLDHSFSRDVMAFSRLIRPDRQVALFSATFPSQLRRTAAEVLKMSENEKLVQLEIGGDADHTGTADEILHKFHILPSLHEKRRALMDFFHKGMIGDVDYSIEIDGTTRAPRNFRTLVFCKTKRDCSELALWSNSNGLKGRAIHGDCSQVEREDALKQFKQGQVHILYATDVVSRGIDIGGIRFVIQYDAPERAEDYIHRSGRTGRAGNLGTSILFISSRDAGFASQYQNLLKHQLKNKKNDGPEKLNELFTGGGSGGGGYGRGGGRSGGGGRW